ncbi:MAG: C39 family peptidase, partial [Chloroflexi bacterium]|nr:C39 family peptidase [Chloroflexota bacterium]
VKVEGVAHQYQKWTNCGPATLSMALSYWGWKGNQLDTAAYLKPNPGDVNVMPFEMTGYVEDETDMLAIRRVGADLALIKSMVANGYAVIVEKGTDYKDGWVGHYVLVTGYDDGREMFITQDSLAGVDFEVAYEEILSNWRVFNYTFIIVYPSESEAEVMTLLGPWVDEAWAAGHALNLASQQIESEVGRALYFAWFNKGSSHVLRGEYAAAASAYDVAFDLYSRLTVDERPWRMMWYQTGPYEAYYQAGRYNDVINLANTTLWAAARSVMEESYYWRGMAKEALGDLDGALSDYRKSVDMNPNFGLGIEALERLEQGN